MQIKLEVWNQASRLDGVGIVSQYRRDQINLIGVSQQRCVSSNFSTQMDEREDIYLSLKWEVS